MEKKVLKMYETPSLELVELNVNGQILAGSPTGGGSADIPKEDVDEGFFD